MSEHIWSTPSYIFDALNHEFMFDVDLCAEPINRKCIHYLTKEDSLACEWLGVGWLNPPFGNGIDGWLRKAWESANKGATIVALVPGRTNAPWWHNYVMQADEIRFVRKKMAFVADDGKKGVPSWGAVIVIFRKHGNSMPKCLSWDQPQRSTQVKA